MSNRTVSIDVLQPLRLALERLWQDRRQASAKIEAPPDVPLSHHMCRFSCGFLQIVLRDTGYGRWSIRGGAPWPPFYQTGGLLTPHGEWHGHYWLEQRGQLIDLTADQFGYAPIILSDSRDQRYAANYTAAEIADHLQHCRLTIASWLTDYRRIPDIEASITTPNTFC